VHACADINDWAAMSAEYVKFFPNHKPARSAFATTGLALGARVEIECLAYIKK
jgi:2-iminobutanoate/2-iminopropanoate deaminase